MGAEFDNQHGLHAADGAEHIIICGTNLQKP